LLFGAAGRIEAAEACANVAAEPARAFEIDPAALFAAYRRARGGEAQIIGHYHSHPSGEAMPSARDAAQAMGDGALWLILTAREARLWVSVRPGAFEAVGLRVEDG
jgi:proteasome lid subunit RPN8/RPN11